MQYIPGSTSSSSKELNKFLGSGGETGVTASHNVCFLNNHHLLYASVMSVSQIMMNNQYNVTYVMYTNYRIICIH